MEKSIASKGFKSLVIILMMIIATASFNLLKADVVGVEGGSVTSLRIETFNENTWASVSGPATLTLAGYTVGSAQAVTWNSDNLLYYAILTVDQDPPGGAITRNLVTVNVATGVCANIGDMGGAYSTLTYNSNTGVLYTMGGSGSPTLAERLYSVNMSTGATTFLGGPYPIGAFGEVIAYNYDDNSIYHWSSGGMEKINASTFIATPIVISGAIFSEVQGAVYLGGNVFSVTDLDFVAGTTDGFKVTSAGVATHIGSTPYQVRGLGFANPLLPVELSSFNSSVSGNNVTLNWTTASETNNSGFTIERKSNGQWSDAGFVSGNGTTTSAKNYSFTDGNLSSGNYGYRLKQTDYNGNFEYFNLNNEVNVGTPSKYSLSQNYPNPFNPSTSISFEIPTDGKVSLKIFDMSGKQVASLVNDVRTAGYYTINFNAASLSSGVYLYSLSANNFTAVKKMTLLK